VHSFAVQDQFEKLVTKRLLCLCIQSSRVDTGMKWVGWPNHTCTHRIHTCGRFYLYPHDETTGFQATLQVPVNPRGYLMYFYFCTFSHFHNILLYFNVLYQLVLYSEAHNVEVVCSETLIYMLKVLQYISTSYTVTMFIFNCCVFSHFVVVLCWIAPLPLCPRWYCFDKVRRLEEVQVAPRSEAQMHAQC